MGQHRNGLAIAPPPDPALVDGMHRKDDERPASRWWIAIIVVIGLLLVGFGVWLTQSAGSVEDQLGTTAQQYQDLGQSVTAACTRGDVVQTPAGQNLCQRGAEAQSAPIPGPAGERGPAGESIVGPKGDPGEPGADGQPGADSTVPGPMGPQGQPGADGQPGSDGSAGPAGVDGQPGQPGESIPGPAGPMGPQGEQGPEGEQGDPGPTCPDGSTLQTVEFASGETGLGCVTSTGEPIPPDPDGGLLDG